MAFGPEMHALPKEGAPPVVLKAITPEEAPLLPEIDYSSAIARILPRGYVHELNDQRDPDSLGYMRLAEFRNNMHWGIFAGGPDHARPIGIAGFMDMRRTGKAHVRIAITDPQFHGQGVASRTYPLMSWAARGAGEQRVTAAVREDNRASRALHARMGFVCVGESTGLGGPAYKDLRQYLEADVLSTDALFEERVRADAERGIVIDTEALRAARLRTLHVLDLADVHMTTHV